MSKKNRNKIQYKKKNTSVKKKQPNIVQTIKKEAPSKFENFINKYALLTLIGLILLIGIFAFKDYLSIKYIYFFKDIGSDTLNNVFPSLYLSAQLKAESWFTTWTFNVGMGQVHFSGVPSPLNPFYYLNYLINTISEFAFGENYFVYNRFLDIFFTHFLVSGIVFYYFLRSLSIEKLTSIIGALLVAFLGYAILGSSWGHSSIVRASIIFLFAAEQFIGKKRWYFFPIAALFIVSNPFYLYINTLFIVIYLVFRFFFFEDSKFKEYLLNTGKLFLLGTLGVLLNLVNITNSYFVIFNSPRVGGGVGYYDKLSSTSVFSTSANHYGETLSHHLTAMYRLFSNDILGNGSNFKGWYNYLEAPVFYAGLLTLLLIPQIFTFVKKKQKIAVASFLSFWALIVIFPFFRYAFNAFTGDYYKIGLDVFIPISLILIAIFAFNYIYKEAKINRTTLILTLIILLAALYLPDLGTKKSIVVSSVRNWVALILVSYSVLLFGLQNLKYRNLALIGIFIVIFIEMTSFSYHTVNERVAYETEDFKQSAGGYFDNTIDAVTYIDSLDNSFFRTEKDYWSGTSEHGSLNDAKVQGYYGTTSYSSFNQGNYIRFLQEAGVIDKGNESQTRWSPGLRGQPILSTWGNVKYFLTRNDSSNFLQLGYTKLTKIGDVNVLKNHYYLPLAYTYSSFMSLQNFRELTRFQKDMALLNTVIIESEERESVSKTLYERQKKDSLIAITEAIFGASFYQFHKNDFDTSADAQKSLYGQFRDHLIEDTLSITAHGQNFIEGTISLKKAKLLFFTIPYDKGWKATVNGKEHEIIKSNIGFTGLMLQAGKYDIKLNYLPPYFNTTLWITIIANILFLTLIAFTIIRNRKIRNTSKTTN